jgi:hypothetical protein
MKTFGTIIAKIQRPLFSNTGNPPAMAYDQARNFTIMLPVTDDLLKLFGEKMKIYAEVIRNGESLEIVRVVPDRGW